jgi:uncharacterized membrane-anchored protein
MSWALFWTLIAAIVVFCLFWIAIQSIEVPPAPKYLKMCLKILLCVVTAVVIAVRFHFLHG